MGPGSHSSPSSMMKSPHLLSIGSVQDKVRHMIISDYINILVMRHTNKTFLPLVVTENLGYSLPGAVWKPLKWFTKKCESVIFYIIQNCHFEALLWLQWKLHGTYHIVRGLPILSKGIHDIFTPLAIGGTTLSCADVMATSPAVTCSKWGTSLQLQEYTNIDLIS